MKIVVVHDDQPVSCGEVAQDDTMFPLSRQSDYAVVIDIASKEIDVRLVLENTRKNRFPVLLHIKIR